MGRGSKRQRRPPKNTKNNRNDGNVFANGALDDEIDAYHRQRDVIPLDANAADGDSSDAEEPVFNLGGDNINDTESGSDDDDDDNDVDEDIQPNKFSAKIARTKKFLKQKFGGSDDEMHDDDDDDDEDKEEQRKAAWGGKKSWYYDADNADYELQSSDEDLPMEEEAEAVRIQKEKAKFLSLEDFGLEEADESGGDSHAKEKKQKAVLDVRKSRERFNTEGFRGETTLESFEEIKIDLNSLSKEELMDAVYSSAPELVGLLSELSEAWSQVEKLEPLVCEVKERKDGAKGKMHHLEVKRLLLLTYCQAIVFYLLLKSEGHPVQDHPVVGRLVEIKAMMEQMKQIEANIPSQVDKKFTQKVATKSTDKLVNQSEVTNVPTKTHESPVKVSTHLAIDGSLKKKHNKHVNQKDQVFQGIGLQSMEMLKVRADLEAKLKQKGLYDLKNSKNGSNQKNSSKPVNKHLETQDDFDDEVQPVVNSGKQGVSKLSKLIPNKGNKPKFVSGDDDLPMRDDIGERRRKHELRVLARAGTVSMDDDIGLGNKSMDIDAHKDDETTDPEDDFYKEVKRQRMEKLNAKAALYSRTPVAPSTLETEEGGRRPITYQIEKNKGLTRHRKKLTKIPRKKYKIKHQKAVIRRKGQVRDIRRPSGPYGGEATGINPNISRSIRFKN